MSIIEPRQKVENEGGTHPIVAERLRGLDALRGIAALTVVLSHYTSTYHTIYGHPNPPQFSIVLGREAVNLFFVII